MADRPAPVLAPAPGHEGDAAGPSDSAYSTIGVEALWGIFSLGCFILSLFSRHFAHWLVPSPTSPLTWAFLPAGIVVGCATLGTLSGYVGTKRSRRPGLARIGLFLNVVVLVVAGMLAFVLVRFASR